MGSIPPPSLSPSVRPLFGAYEFPARSYSEGFLAKMTNPANGFDPFQMANGTELLFVSNPAQLPHPLSFHLTPQWRNGLGLVIFRNEEAKAVGAIFIHGAMKTPWSSIQPNAWQALGGVMAFSGMSFNDAIEIVLGKGMAMTPKWRFIDRSLAAAGHPTMTDLGGAKAIVLHDPSREGKEKAIRIAGQVARQIGIYISGADQNTAFDEKNNITWCDLFSEEAPFNFMGSQAAPEGYEGMRNPSPFTARGVLKGIEEARRELLGRAAPVFIQGCGGGVGKVIAAVEMQNKSDISGGVDAVVERLLMVRNNGLKAPLFLDVSGTESQFGAERRLEEEALAREHGIPIVQNLMEAIEEARRMGHPTEILSPNAGPHPITQEVAEYLIRAGVRAVVGAANNMLGLVDGSPETVAWTLQQGGVFVPNDSRINRMGAMSVTVKKIGLNTIGLGLQEQQVGEDVREEIFNAYRQGIPPQLYSDQVAARDWNEALREERAIGGYFEIRPIVPPGKISETSAETSR